MPAACHLWRSYLDSGPVWKCFTDDFTVTKMRRELFAIRDAGLHATARKGDGEIEQCPDEDILHAKIGETTSSRVLTKLFLEMKSSNKE